MVIAEEGCIVDRYSGRHERRLILLKALSGTGRERAILGEREKFHQSPLRRPQATQKGSRSLNLMSTRPAPVIITSISARVKRCSSRVPNRSRASVRIV